MLKTSSGKIRRSATRDAYLAGTLERGRRSPIRQWAHLVVTASAAFARRLGGSLVALVLAAWVGVLLVLALPLLQVALVLTPRGEAADRLLRFFARWVLAAAGCRVRVEGLSYLEGIGPAVLTPNHSSYVDTVALLAGIPTRLLFVAKHELVETPLIRTAISKPGHPSSSASTSRRASPTPSA